MTMRKTEDKTVGPCWLCGKNFIIKVRKSDRKIMSACFHSNVRKRYFMHWGYPVDDCRKKFEMSKLKRFFYFEEVHFSGFGKNKKARKRDKLFWTIVGYTKLQRWIIYNIWYLIYGRAKIEYWECSKCCKK